MRTALPLALLVLGSLVTLPAAAEVDAAALHGENCTSCHASLTGGDPNRIYTRENRRVTSLEGLEKQVRRCELSLGLQWFDDQVAAVTEYLNESYYQFGN
jgi:mono/diheme cytochrome c family protein